jgi:hypothetical protein
MTTTTNLSDERLAHRCCTGDHMPVRVNPVVPTGLHAHQQPAPQRVTPDYIADVFLTLVLEPNDHGHSLLVELGLARGRAGPYTTSPPFEEQIELGGDGDGAPPICVFAAPGWAVLTRRSISPEALVP